MATYWHTTADVSIEVDAEVFLDAYDFLSAEEQQTVLDGLRDHYEDVVLNGNELEYMSEGIGKAASKSSFDLEKVNQYLSFYGFKLMRRI